MIINVSKNTASDSRYELDLIVFFKKLVHAEIYVLGFITTQVPRNARLLSMEDAKETEIIFQALKIVILLAKVFLMKMELLGISKIFMSKHHIVWILQ